MSSKDNTQHQKYKVLLQIEEKKQNDIRTKRRNNFYDPNNPYQLIETILISKAKNKKN